MKDKKLPYIYDEVRNIFLKAGLKLDGVYAFRLETNLRELDEGRLTIWRYKLRDGKPYLNEDQSDAAVEPPETYTVLTIKRGEDDA